MRGKSNFREKQRYWESRARDILNPIPVEELILLSWAIEAYRDGRKREALKFVNFPGEPDDHQIGRKYFIPPWSIDALINEKLRLGIEPRRTKKRLNLHEWNAVALLINTFKGLLNIESTMDIAPNDIMAAMPRILWPQLDWQLGYESISQLARAWYLYATENGRRAFLEKNGMELDAFLKSMFALYAASDENPIIKPSDICILGINIKTVSAATNIIGKSLLEHSVLAKEIRQGDVPREFQRSTVREYPVMFSRNAGEFNLYVPSRTSLMRRISDGLYFDIVHDDKARNEAAGRFELLCQNLIKHYWPDQVDVEGEIYTSYGVSADIIVLSKYAKLGIIFECKNLRIPQRIRTSSNPWRDHAGDFQQLVKAITQIWRSLTENPFSERDFRGVVVTYDGWTVMGSTFISEIFRRAHSEADKIQIPIKCRVPVSFVYFWDLESILTSFDFIDLYEGIHLASTEDYHGYHLSGVVREIAEQKERKSRLDYSKIASESVPWWDDWK